jgi:hypothetical protein
MPCKRTIPRVCGHCQSDFLARPDLVNAGKALYCSVACRTAASRGRPSPLLGTGHQILFECDHCGEPFRPHAPNAVNRQRFCGWDCKSAAETKRVTIPDDERDLIYLAGFIDGEGTITALRQTRVQTGNESMSFRVMLANSHEPVMRWIYETFGGGLSNPRSVRSVKHKPVMTWYIGAYEALALCHRLLPYLKVKRRQAEIIIALSEFGYERSGKGPRWVSDENYAARVPLLAEIRRLNHRGVLPPETSNQ